MPCPTGSVQIEDLFESYFTKAGEPYDDAEFSGRSDYQAFIQQRHPGGRSLHRRRGGQDGGAGGDLGRHRGCAVRPVLPPGVRHIANVDEHALDVNIDAIAFAVLAYSVLDAVRQRRPRRTGPRWPQAAGPGGPGRHDRVGRRSRARPRPRVHQRGLTDELTAAGPGAPRRAPPVRPGPGPRAASALRERLDDMSVPAVTTRPHVVVVGGGIAGLTAALEVLEALPVGRGDGARGQRPSRRQAAPRERRRATSSTSAPSRCSRCAPRPSTSRPGSVQPTTW